MATSELRCLVQLTVFATTLLFVCGFSIGGQDGEASGVKCWHLRTSGVDVCTVNGWFKVLKDMRELDRDEIESTVLSPQLIGQLLDGGRGLESTSLLGNKEQAKEKRKFDSISYNNGMGGF